MGEDIPVGFFVVGDPNNAYRNPSKTTGNIAFPSILAGTLSTAMDFGIAEESWPKESEARDFAAGGYTQLTPRHAKPHTLINRPKNNKRTLINRQDSSDGTRLLPQTNKQFIRY